MTIWDNVTNAAYEEAHNQKVEALFARDDWSTVTIDEAVPDVNLNNPHGPRAACAMFDLVLNAKDDDSDDGFEDADGGAKRNCKRISNVHKAARDAAAEVRACQCGSADVCVKIAAIPSPRA